MIAGHIALCALSSRHRWPGALKLLDTMAQSRLPQGHVAHTAAAGACERLAAWRPALRLLGARPALQVYAAALNACPWAGGLQLMRRMRQGATEPDLQTCNALLARSPWPQALLLLEHMASWPSQSSKAWPEALAKMAPDTWSFHCTAAPCREPLPHLLANMEFCCLGALTKWGEKPRLGLESPCFSMVFGCVFLQKQAMSIHFELVYGRT